ncbi:Gamma-aminobutyric acid (GABA) B receptor [Seminavis robusta]|uniref:Gamma-aminobutyric acid (GABA) B receptor n=1 Tax=Seminavis robusta TaxID=568900 RepID=A0A9N8HH25_9STRA|nr:Gamma-aminobutyric acid (GABA) B receptor [Seminavis robusta]|eukprot:Sro676_g185720.1 Gamma-aminobutyric acid (GABA) B receptor (961) ;mRNA; f:35789-39446
MAPTQETSFNGTNFLAHIHDPNEEDMPSIRFGWPVFLGVFALVVLVAALVAAFLLLCSRKQEQGAAKQAAAKKEQALESLKSNLACKPWSPDNDTTEKTADASDSDSLSCCFSSSPHRPPAAPLDEDLELQLKEEACLGYEDKDSVGGSTPENNGSLSLLVALPLTTKISSNDSSSFLEMNSIGIYQLAAAQLAVEMFNTRNASLVPALADLPEGCNTSITLQVVDTSTTSAWNLSDDTSSTTMVDAIVGPYYEIPAMEWSVLASTHRIPMVSHLVSHNNHNLQLQDRYPFFTQISATVPMEMKFVTQYLRNVQRTKYIAILYPNRPSSIHQVKLLWELLQQYVFQHVRLFVYQPPPAMMIHKQQQEQQTTCGPPEHQIPTVLEQIQRSGFRTIVLLGAMPEEVPLLASAATQQKLDQGNHLWILSSSPELLVASPVMMMTPNFLVGAAYLTPDEYHLHEYITSNPVEQYYDELLVGSSVPDTAGMPEESRTSDGKQPQIESPSSRTFVPGMGFLFDAVMSVGMAACQGVASTNQTVSSGPALLESIRSLEFRGASGHVQFGKGGSRLMVPFTVLNLIYAADRDNSKNNASDKKNLVARQTATWDPAAQEWEQIQPFHYADGTTDPPNLLRAIPNQNYITAGARAYGLTLFVIAIVTVIVSAAWVFIHQDESAVIASQPIFLYTICFASGLSGLTILIAAFDESWGMDQAALTHMCFAWTWLDAMATTVIYSALFTKLWRTNRCLREKTNNIALWRVMWPFALFLLAAVAIMTAMTIHSDYGWVRFVVDEESGESVGYCSGETLYFLVPLHTVHMIPICLSAFMALKTKEFGDTHTESKWVLTLLAVQCQFMFASVPTIFLLGAHSPTANYIGLASFWFTIPISAMGLLVLPKAITFHRMKRMASEPYPSTETMPASVNPTTASGEQQSRDDQGSDDWRSSLVEQSPSLHGPKIQIVTFD